MRTAHPRRAKDSVEGGCKLVFEEVGCI